jgi:hypothetical protein
MIDLLLEQIEVLGEHLQTLDLVPGFELMDQILLSALGETFWMQASNPPSEAR